MNRDAATAGGGTALHLARWPATGAPVRGTVQIVHGLGEHIGRYAALAAALNGAGWQVAGHDHRGHGASGGARGAVPTAHALLDDLAVVVDRVRAQDPSGRHVLLGHSLGGLVAARFVAEGLAATPAPWYRPCDALVLSSPAFDAGLGPVQRLLLAVLGRVAPGVGVGNGLDAAWISRDARVVQRYRDDARVHARVTPRLVRFIVDAGRDVLALAPRWRTPTLLLWAGADRCVAPAGSAAFAAAAPPAVVDAQCWTALYHEIFNEPERDQVIERLVRWLDAR